MTEKDRGSWRQYLSLLFTIHCSLFTISCTQDAYDKGEGTYSLMRADFVEAHANAEKKVDYVETDDGERLTLTTPVSTSWIGTADSVYRCILYYNKVEDERGAQSAQPLSIGQVPCPSFRSPSEMKVVTDPVKFESLWRSRSGKYVNMRFLLMTGITDDTTAVNNLALIADTILVNPDSTRTRYLRLHHERVAVPEYFSTEVFLSIPSERIEADSLCISVNTYDGVVTRTIKR